MDTAKLQQLRLLADEWMADRNALDRKAGQVGSGDIRYHIFVSRANAIGTCREALLDLLNAWQQPAPSEEDPCST